MTTSLQYLHENLYQLKASKWMDDLRFRELYEEAKMHEKHANLTNLVSRSKNDKVSQETNFYLILTRMLAELKENEENDIICSSNLDKIYKWYLQNKRASNKTNHKPVKLSSSTNSNNNNNNNNNVSSKTLESVNTSNISKNNEQMYSQKNTGRQSILMSSSRLGTQLDDTRLTNHNNMNISSVNAQSNLISSRRSSSRAISPVRLPLVNNNSNKLANTSTSSITRSITPKENKLLKDTVNSTANMSSTTQKTTSKPSIEKLPDLVSKDLNRGSQNLSSLSELILNQKKLDTNRSDLLLNEKQEKKNEINEKTRIGILKALSNYAEKLYSELDKKDTRKLESNLKSLSRFYYALNEAEEDFETNQTNNKLESDKNKYALVRHQETNTISLTLNSLVEMAKEVSDRMILSKAEASIRHSQNRLWFESSKRLSDPSINSKSQTIEDTKGLTKDMINNMIKNSNDTTFKLPVYSVVIKKSTRRPKSSTFPDWRGHISRPSTGKSKASLKIGPTRSKSTPNPKSANPSEHSDFSDNEDSNIRLETSSLKEKKPKRSTLKSSKISRSTDSLSTENKEVKFMNFIKKIDDTGTEVVKLKSDNESMSGKSSKLDKKTEKTDSYIELPTQKFDLKSQINNDNDNDKLQIENDMMTPRELTESRLKDIDMLKCLHNEIITCECCTQNVSTLQQQSADDIFHLTSTNEDLPLKSTSYEDRTTNTAVEADQKPDLREILLNNYDPKFAAKIGIKDFIPIEVMNNHLDEDSKPLEFIPFENIDHSYPKLQGQPVFDPIYNKPLKRLYRTNPSIPRPESKYGTRSNVYEQILNYKKQNLDSNALVVWQPEDVILVRDLLELENEPLNELLKVEPLKVPNKSVELSEIDAVKNTELTKVNINVNITPMGRPINNTPHVRWKQVDFSASHDEKTELISVDSYWNPTDDKHYNSYENSKAIFTARDSIMHEADGSIKPIVHRYRPKGSAASRSTNYDNNRPLPIEMSPDVYISKEDARFNEAKKSVHIPSIFKGTTVQNYVKEFSLEERARREQQRLAAIKIQQSYRQHIRNKRFIEQSAPITSDKTDWFRNHKSESDKRRSERDYLLKKQEKTLNKENLKLKNTLKHVGMHIDLYEVLYQKGPEYTNKILNKAAKCIQRWIRGWLVRKELKKLKETILNDGITTWSAFLKHYRRTIKRILIIRGDHKTKFDFNIKEVTDFYLKEKRYNTYYEKLQFMDQLDMNDLEKMFNYADLYPSTSELKEAKDNVLKFYKKKNSVSSFQKNMIFDMIYYIYPPAGTKLKSTRKSTWQNPRVGNEDALRLRGFKFIEQPNFENAWQLVAQTTINQNLDSSK